MYMISQNMKKDNFAIQYQYQKCNDAVLVFILHLTIEKICNADIFMIFFILVQA